MNGDVTNLLSLWAQGNRSALDSLTPLVYDELHKLAGSHLRRERNGHTLQPTALVHEAWMRLVRQDDLSFENRHRFYAMAAQIMRQVLVDHARRAGAQKRGGPAESLSESDPPPDRTAGRFEEYLALDEALTALARVSERQAKVIELRYFGGLTGDDIAHLLGVSAATISREQRSGEAWLSHVVSTTTRFSLSDENR
jgi:RNA polymerase sigma-70 factor (ECF subfamily)